MQKINLFSGLEKENNVSSILVNLIKKYPIFKNKWKEFLKINNIDLIDTEVDLKQEDIEFGRIDIYIENDTNEILVENKIWCSRGLTDNQPSNYIKYLEKKKESKLIFLIPKHYHHTNKLTSYKKNEKFSIKYWEDFIAELKKDDFHKINIFIEEFVDFMEKILFISHVHLSKTEKKLLNKEFSSMENRTIPKIMKELFSIVDAVKDGGKIKVANSLKPTEYENSYGYELKLPEDNKVFVWFGIDYNVWENNGSPIIIWIADMSLEQIKILKKEGFEYYTYEKEDDAMIYSFNNFLDQENISEKISEKLDSLIDLLKSNTQSI